MKHGFAASMKDVHRNTLRRWYRYALFTRDFLVFRRLHASERFSMRWSERYPCLDEKTPTLDFDAHYIYHPAWAARILAASKPPLHVDISSTLAFSTMVSAFLPIEFFDYRPADLNMSNFASKRADLLHLPFDTDSVGSLSCMHVVEHVGLGRYGDKLDPDGDLKAIAELKRVLKPRGNLLFVAPIGHPCIQFNAHRIYSYNQIVDYFDGLDIRQFALVDDRGRFTIDAPPDYANQQAYGCGCWWFQKRCWEQSEPEIGLDV